MRSWTTSYTYAPWPQWVSVAFLVPIFVIWCVHNDYVGHYVQTEQQRWEKRCSSAVPLLNVTVSRGDKWELQLYMVVTCAELVPKMRITCDLCLPCAVTEGGEVYTDICVLLGGCSKVLLRVRQWRMTFLLAIKWGVGYLEKYVLGMYDCIGVGKWNDAWRFPFVQQ